MCITTLRITNSPLVDKISVLMLVHFENLMVRCLQVNLARSKAEKSSRPIRIQDFVGEQERAPSFNFDSELKRHKIQSDPFCPHKPS